MIRRLVARIQAFLAARAKKPPQTARDYFVRALADTGRPDRADRMERLSRWFDPEGVFEIPAGDAVLMTAAELAFLDQLMAERREIAKAVAANVDINTITPRFMKNVQQVEDLVAMIRARRGEKEARDA